MEVQHSEGFRYDPANHKAFDLCVYALFCFQVWARIQWTIDKDKQVHIQMHTAQSLAFMAVLVYLENKTSPYMHYMYMPISILLSECVSVLLAP